MKKFLSMLAIASMVTFFTACDDDDDPVTPDGPSITAPSSANIQVGTEADVTFSVTVPGGYKSATVSAEGGTATKKSEPAAGATSGNVVVTFAANATAGAGSVTITVTDNNDKSESETAVINKTTEPQKPVIDLGAFSDGLADIEGYNEATSTLVLSADNIYVLRGFVFVNDGQTLEIEPGTVIKGQPGQQAGASALICARGGKIIAEGTAEAPIIFTALSDDTEDSDDVALTEKGLWGGLVVLGKSVVNSTTGEAAIEGIPATETRGIYGGGSSPEEDDNSGIYKYISIRHGGTVLQPGSEINGFTLGGVGSETEVSHVEVWANADDGIEFFGGTVNTKYLAAIYCQDDSYDWDQGFRGYHQFWLALQQPGYNESNRGMELDGAPSSNLGADIFSRPYVYNLTIVGEITARPESQAIFLTEGSGGYFRNSMFGNFANGISVNNTAGTASKQVIDRLNAGSLAFENNIFFNIGSTPATTFDALVVGIDGATKTALVDHLTDNNNIISTATGITIGANASALSNLLPTADGIGFTHPKAAFPDAPGEGFGGNFEFTTTDYIGAFGESNWLAGWSAASAYGVLND